MRKSSPNRPLCKGPPSGNAPYAGGLSAQADWGVGAEPEHGAAEVSQRTQDGGDFQRCGATEGVRELGGERPQLIVGAGQALGGGV